jgi:hypothetical protein
MSANSPERESYTLAVRKKLSSFKAKRAPFGNGISTVESTRDPSGRCSPVTKHSDIIGPSRLHIARQLNDRVAGGDFRACCDGRADNLLNPGILKSDHHPKPEPAASAH